MANPLVNIFQQLRFTIIHVHPEGPPNRRLIIDVQLTNPTRANAVLFGLNCEAEFHPGGTAAVGPLFEQQHALSDRAWIPAAGKMSGRFVIPVSGDLLTVVERERNDRVVLTVRGRALVSPVLGIPFAGRKTNRQSSGEPRVEPVLTVPFETEAHDVSGSAMVTVAIPSSEWIKHLRSWRWEEIEIFEIALDARSEPPQYRRTYENLRKAQQSFRDHDYDATLTHARRALESMAKAAGEGDVKEGYAALLRGRFGGTQMTSDFDALVNAFTRFAHAGRHENVPHEPVGRSDALFALHITLAIVERITH